MSTWLSRQWTEDLHPRSHGKFSSKGITKTPHPRLKQRMNMVNVQVRKPAGDKVTESAHAPIPHDPLAALLDHTHPLTPHHVLDHLAQGHGSPQERQKLAESLAQFRKMPGKTGDGDVAGISAFKFRQLAGAMGDKEDPQAYAAQIAEHIPGDEFANHRAYLMRELYQEQRRREGASVGMDGGPTFKDNKEAAAWADENLPQPDLSAEEKAAVQGYTSADYIEINATARGLDPGHSSTSLDPAQVKAATAHLDAAIAKSTLPTPLLLMRGEKDGGLRSLGVDPADHVSLQSLVGQTTADKAYLSTSLGSVAGGAGSADGNVKWVLRAPAGTPALYADRPDLTAWKGEREVLLGRDTGRLVHAVYRGPDPADTNIYVEAEIVPAGHQTPPDWTPQPRGDAWKAYHRGA